MKKIREKITLSRSLFFGFVIFVVLFEWYRLTVLINIFDDLNSELVRDGSKIMFNLISILFGFTSVSCYFFLSKFYELIEKSSEMMYNIKNMVINIYEKKVSVENLTEEERIELKEEYSTSLKDVSEPLKRMKESGKTILITLFSGFVLTFFMFIWSIFDSMMAFLQANNHALLNSFDKFILATSILIFIDLMYVSFIGDFKDIIYMASDMRSKLQAVERSM